MTTATYFSGRSGEITVGVSSIRKSFQTMRMTDYVPDYSESASVGKRMLLLPDEVLRFPLNQALLIIRGQKVLRVKKLDYTRHPEAKLLKPEKTEEHVPEWREKMEEETGTQSQAEEGWQECQHSVFQDEEEHTEEKPLSIHASASDKCGRKQAVKHQDKQEEGGGRIERVEDLFH